MTLAELFSLRSQMLHEFEEKFSVMTFENDTDRKNYYHAYMKGMTEFFNNSMLMILDKDDRKKAA